MSDCANEPCLQTGECGKAKKTLISQTETRAGWVFSIWHRANTHTQTLAFPKRSVRPEAEVVQFLEAASASVKPTLPLGGSAPALDFGAFLKLGRYFIGF